MKRVQSQKQKEEEKDNVFGKRGLDKQSKMSETDMQKKIDV